MSNLTGNAAPGDRPTSNELDRPLNASLAPEVGRVVLAPETVFAGSNPEVLDPLGVYQLEGFDYRADHPIAPDKARILIKRIAPDIDPRTLTDEQLVMVFKALPELLLSGYERLNPKNQIGQNMRRLYFWLGGDTVEDVADKESCSQGAVRSSIGSSSTGTRKYGIAPAIRDAFTAEEILAGQLSEQESRRISEARTMLRGQKLVDLGFKGNSVESMTPQQVIQFFALIAEHNPLYKHATRAARWVSGEHAQLIIKGDGINVAAWIQGRKRLMGRVAKNIGSFENLQLIIASENPTQTASELGIALTKITPSQVIGSQPRPRKTNRRVGFKKNSTPAAARVERQQPPPHRPELYEGAGQNPDSGAYWKSNPRRKPPIRLGVGMRSYDPEPRRPEQKGPAPLPEGATPLSPTERHNLEQALRTDHSDD